MAATAKKLASGGNPLPATITTIYTAPGAGQVVRLTEVWLYNTHTAAVDVTYGHGSFALHTATLQPKESLPLSLNSMLNATEQVWLNPSVANVVNYWLSGVEDVNG